jgi:ribonucleoside-diphosphate reductase alpha chain
MYYLRTQAATQAVQFTVEKQGGKNMDPVVPVIEAAGVNANDIAGIQPDQVSGPTCSMEEGCVTCSS